MGRSASGRTEDVCIVVKEVGVVWVRTREDTVRGSMFGSHESGRGPYRDTDGYYIRH